MGTMLRNIRWSYLVPLLLAFCFAVGTYSGGDMGELRLFSGLFLGYFLFFAVLFCVLFRWSFALTSRLSSVRLPRPAALDRVRGLLPLDWRGRSVARQAVVLQACWLPYLVGYFPGLYWYDTSWQLYQYFQTPRAVTDHHPFLDTYLFGWFARMGEDVWSNPMYGMFVLVVVQQVLAVVALGCAVSYLSRARVPWGARFAVFVFFAVFPFFPTVFSSLSKDGVSTPFFVFFCLMACEAVRSRGKVARPGLFYAVLFAVSLMTCLTKKTGVYVILPTLLAVILLRQGVRSRIAMAVVALVLAGVMGVVVPRAVLPALHVQPGERSELMAVPLQQLAHVARNDPSGFSGEERGLMERTYRMPLGRLAKAYSYTAADPVKNYPPAKADLPAFVAMWAGQGVRHPSDYLGAWGGLSAGWFSFDALSNSDSTLLRLFPDSSHHMEELDPLVRWSSGTLAGEDLYRVYREAFLGLPVVGALFYKSLWASVLPFLLVFLALRMRRGGARAEAFAMLMPVVMTALSLYAGPTSLYNEAVRYVLPLVCVLPVVGAMMVRAVAADSGREIRNV